MLKKVSGNLIILAVWRFSTNEINKEFENEKEFDEAKEKNQQAGAGLCQAQVKLGLAMPELLIIQVIFSVLENWVYWGCIPSTRK